MSDNEINPQTFLEMRAVNVARGDRIVLHDVNLNIRAGEHVAILGPNGCGKSTLILAMIRCPKFIVTRVQGKAVGGAVGLHQQIARPVGYRCLATEVPDSLERLLGSYLQARKPGENLRAYFARTSDEQLREQLAGAVLESVPRDAAPVGGKHLE